MRLLLIVLLVQLSGIIYSQSAGEWKAADIIALNVPDSCQVSAVSLGKYFSGAFKSKAMRARAAYTWTSANISYDLKNLNKTNAASPYDELVTKTLSTRKAICQGYASVFKAICEACGINAYIVNGFTRQNGHINDISHAWVVAVIDSGWYGFDPTWGSGYLNRGRFVRQLNPQFFMLKPGELIRDHMPFDPMWQCLQHPLSTRDFLDGRTTAAENGRGFAFRDSISAYMAMPLSSQCQSAFRRMEECGIVNSLQMEWSNYLRECIRNEKLNQSNSEKNRYVRQFNSAVSNFNQCITAFNRYVDYFNGSFYPNRPEVEVIAMLDVCYAFLDSCSYQLTAVIATDEDIKQGIEQLRKASEEARKNVDQQMLFVKIYYNTDPVSRPGLFKNYSKLGFPKTR